MDYRGNKLQEDCFWIVVAVVFLYAIRIAFCSLINFDGAVNLQIPISLVEDGLYANRYHQIINFWEDVSTGAPVLLPIAILFKIFGISGEIALLVNSFYFILMIFMMIFISKRLNVQNTWILIFFYVMQLIPNFWFFTFGILGEIPAFSLLLVSLFFLIRFNESLKISYLFWAGFLGGCAYLTKIVILIAVPSFLLFFISKVFVEKKIKISKSLFFPFGFLTPIFLFEVFKLFQLGQKGYILFWKNLVNLVFVNFGLIAGKTNGSALSNVSNSPSLIDKMLVHIDIFSNLFSINKVCFCLLLLLNISFFIYFLLKKKKFEIYEFLSFFMISFFVWWIFITPTGVAWARRIFIGVICLVWVTIINFGKFFKFDKNIIFLPIACSVAIVFSIKLYQCESVGKEHYTKFANKVKEIRHKEGAIFCGLGWWQAPIISFYSRIDFCDLTRINLNGMDKPVYLVINNNVGDIKISQLPYSLKLKYEQPEDGLFLYSVNE